MSKSEPRVCSTDSYPMLKVTYTQQVLYHWASSPAWKPQLSLQTLWFIEIATFCSQLTTCLFAIYTHVKVSFVASGFLWIMQGYFLIQGFAWKWMQSVEEHWLCPSRLGSAEKAFFPRHKNLFLDIPVHINDGLWTGVSELIEMMEYAQIWSYSFVLYPEEKKWSHSHSVNDICITSTFLSTSGCIMLPCILFPLPKRVSSRWVCGTCKRIPVTVF